MQRIELLAPAGSLQSGLTAINSGADAVYIGASRFGARQAAGNTLEDIAALIRYAHRYYARVYATINTLLYDDELPQAVELAHQLYQAGVDALIIQDAGLLEADLPPLPLFASTQMHNHTPQRVSFLEKVGFQRAILARELSLAHIREIRTQTNLELETFIHGALCVSYSGQCYLSYALGGRSGNRGECAQPCRKRYELLDGEGKSLGKRYWLSLKDLQLSQHLGELLEAGVTSFKIEGRLKDQAYVTNITSHYRSLLDGIFAGGGYKAASSGRVRLNFTPDPHKSFNRGTSTYFLNGREKGIASPDTPKSLGEPLGKIASVGKDHFTLERSIDLQPGDGLCFFEREGELAGAAVQRVEGSRIFPARMDGLDKGMEMYRNHDQGFLRLLEKNPPVRKIAVRLQLSGTAQGIALRAEDEDGIKVTCTLTCEKAPAQKPELARKTIEKQLGSLGETIFEAQEIEIEFEEMPFLPVSVLNRLRRETIELLEVQREMERPRPKGGAVRNHVPFPVGVIHPVANAQQDFELPLHKSPLLDFRGNVLNQKAEAFYRRHGVQEIEPAAESGQDMHGRTVMTTKLCLRYELGACLREKTRVNLCAPLSLLDEEGNRLELRFECDECQMKIILA